MPCGPRHCLRTRPTQRTLARSTAGSRVWHYNYFRSYSAERGRYTQADPIGLDGGFNRFGYVEGDALSYADPFGLSRLTLTLSGGQKIIVENPSATDLINSINSVEDGKIITFQLSGHGDEFSQCISAGRGCRDALTKNLGLLSNGVLVGNIKDALLRKMNSQGEVRLEGCNNASGDRNMVKSISEHMGSIPCCGWVVVPGWV
ncbi:RHS repeat-associated core domain-containing protein [Acidovorax sp. CF316]|uniref:RHS repeat-associated core domain-containing protein n=1 Tax=Acidovorax sp. CF316 TaxID=1144317 RepID=UPI0009D99EA5|nr:RHS repeat-associated core domain-containing protein [Acidovorax sp. CF316]